jgi:hypothetical protein
MARGPISILRRYLDFRRFALTVTEAEETPEAFA